MRVLLIAAALVAMSFGATQARDDDKASLQLVSAGPGGVIQDGAQWRCEATACQASHVKGLPALRACKRVVAELGAVSAFTWRGKALGAEDLAACNAAAKP
jgi:hypothetical protein